MIFVKNYVTSAASACDFFNFNDGSKELCEDGPKLHTIDRSNFAAFQRLNGQISNLSPREVIMTDNKRKMIDTY